MSHVILYHVLTREVLRNTVVQVFSQNSKNKKVMNIATAPIKRLKFFHLAPEQIRMRNAYAPYCSKRGNTKCFLY